MEFAEFFRREQASLVRMCWLLTLDDQAAADVAQEAMARAWSSWGRLAAEGENPAGWVRTVAANLARSRWRKLRREAAVLSRLGDRTSRQQLADPALEAALGKLAPRQREAVVLRYWADLPVAGCAEVMGVSPGSVKQHLARAHRRLADLVEPSMLQGLEL